MDDDKATVVRTATNAIVGGAVARGLGLPAWVGSLATVAAQELKNDPRLPRAARQVAAVISAPGELASGSQISAIEDVEPEAVIIDVTPKED